ncbi:MAG: molybdate ABC transporter substrate-binding protein [Roseiflexaceae bacterium]
MHRRRFLALIATSTLANLVGAACSTTPAATGLNLAVASSLKDVMQALDAAYATQIAAPAATIQAAGSGALAKQLIEGAKADLFASADRTAMDKVVAAGLIDPAAVNVIAHGMLVVAVRPGAPVPDLQALATNGIKVVMADTTVPAGKYGVTLLDNLSNIYGADYATQVKANVVSYETSVRAVLQKITSGEADAGIVYASDVVAVGKDKVQVLTIPADATVVAEYVAAPLKSGASTSQAFLDYIVSDAAKPIWAQYGFTI